MTEPAKRQVYIEGGAMLDQLHEFPKSSAEEKESLLSFLQFARTAILTKADGLSTEQARWHLGGKLLLPMAGIINHAAMVEYRWIELRMSGVEPSEAPVDEFYPTPHFRLDAAVSAYLEQANRTDLYIRHNDLQATECRAVPGANLRWVVLHLIQETARHAGHADSWREIFDGKVGE